MGIITLTKNLGVLAGMGIVLSAFLYGPAVALLLSLGAVIYFTPTFLKARKNWHSYPGDVGRYALANALIGWTILFWFILAGAAILED